MIKNRLAANLYNPHEQSKAQLVESFVVRHQIFSELYESIKSSGMTPARHYLIEGQRGSGKTTLLLRLSYEIESDPILQRRTIPIVLKEEAYYGIQRLYTLWEMTARELETKDSVFAGLARKMGDAYNEQTDYEQVCFEMLIAALKTHSRKIVFFVDNFGELLRNFSDREYQRLHHILKECPYLRIIGASAIALGAFANGHTSFYTLFQEKYLESLDKEETYDLLLELARTYEKEAAMRRMIAQQPGRVESLRILTGGVIRTIVLLFEIFIEQEENETLADLDLILDRVTPLYKSRMDGLTPPQQAVVNAIALNWDAISPEDIARKTRLNLDEVTAVLYQLEHIFLIERVPSTTRQRFYRLKERFFNIWYLMRLSFGVSQAKVIWLLHFLESWYNQAELNQRAKIHIKSVKAGKYQPNSAFYLTEAFVKTGLLDQDAEHQMILATQKMLRENDLQLAAKSSPSDKELFEKGEAHYQQEEYKQAIKYFSKLKRKNAHMYFRLGYALSRLQQYQKAIPYFLQAAKQGHVEAMLHLGMIYHHLRDYYNAKRYYAMAAGKGHTDAMLHLGNLFYYVGDYHNAKKYYLMVVKKGRVRSKILTTSGNFNLHGLKNYLVKAIKGDIDDPEHYEFHDFPGAKKNYLSAIKKTMSEAMFQLGNLYTSALKNTEKAENSYRIAAEAGHVDAMVALGDLYNYTAQNPKKAEKYYRLAAKKQDLQALVNLGLLYHNTLQDYKKAEKCYLLAVEKGDVSAMNGLAWLYFEQKREKQKSLHYARQTINVENSIYTAHTAACIYLWNNQPAEAFQLAEKFLYAREAYDTLQHDILFYLMLLLAKQHYHQVMTYFESSVLDLQERFKLVYYALLYFIGDPDYYRLPPELSEPVKDIIRQVKQMAEDYE